MADTNGKASTAADVDKAAALTINDETRLGSGHWDGDSYAASDGDEAQQCEIAALQTQDHSLQSQNKTYTRYVRTNF